MAIVKLGGRVFWDSELPGFGIWVHATGRKIFVPPAAHGLPPERDPDVALGG